MRSRESLQPGGSGGGFLLPGRSTFIATGLAAGIILVAAGCGGGSGGGGAGGAPVPAAIDPEGQEIVASGGEGTGVAGEGGEGGVITITYFTQSRLEVLTSGEVDASFDVPLSPVLLGDNPRTITVSATLTPEDDGTIFGDDGTSVATGLHVLPGVTLSLEPNLDFEDSTAFDTVELDFEAGVLIEGTVAALESEEPVAVTPTAHLTIAAREIMVVSGGAIVTSGAAAPSGSTLSAAPAAGRLVLRSRGALVVRGAVRARGGDGAGTGGAGGEVVLAITALGGGEGDLFAVGEIDASGGAGAAGAGGEGGEVTCAGERAGIFLGGTIASRGGDGASGGGPGGSFTLAGRGSGSGGARSRAAIDVSGGDASGASGDGGGGGAVTIEEVGFLRIAGSITARGGGGSAAGAGGRGGEVEVGAEPEQEVSGNISGERRRGIELGAAIDVSGGEGGDGGAGGVVLVSLAESPTIDHEDEAPITLRGYRRLVASGGDGVAAGGAASQQSQGAVSVTGSGGGIEQDFPSAAGILNEAALEARGGDASAGPGGAGGTLVVAAGTSGTSENRGAMDARGGNGSSGGNGGSCVNSGFSPDNSGALDASGGDGDDGPGGDAGLVVVAGALSANAAALRADGGGSAADEGGRGGTVVLFGLEVRSVGDLSARGGDGVTGGDARRAPPSGGFSGPDAEFGGIIFGSSSRASELRGRLDVSGGSGATAGAGGRVGQLLIDGIVIDVPGGVRSF